MADLAHTSVPRWTYDEPGQVPWMESSSVRPVLVGVGDDGQRLVHRWRSAMTDRASRHALTILVETREQAVEQLEDALARAQVGTRVMVAGPSGVCLTLRAVAFNCDVEDDETWFESIERGSIEVHCSHCRAVTAVIAAIDEVVPCPGCARRLLVYHHVARRSGRFLGFMVDAEEQIPESAAAERVRGTAG